jgi:hypothetical protein
MRQVLAEDHPTYEIHNSHCCKHHGCKYGNEDCPVYYGDAPGIICEDCEYELQDIQSQHLFLLYKVTPGIDRQLVAVFDLQDSDVAEFRRIVERQNSPNLPFFELVAADHIVFGTSAMLPTSVLEHVIDKFKE